MAKKATSADKQDLSDGGAAQRIKPADLDFDRSNPRLADSDFHGGSDEDYIRFLWREMNIEELALSIAAWGYFDHEPLIAVEEGGRYVVIEGNRRLAAVKLLRDTRLQERLKVSLPSLKESVRKDTDRLPVVVTTRKDVWQYIGFKHVNGPKPWGALAKAKYIAHVHNDFNVPLDEIPRLIGDTNATVRRLYRGLMVLEQAQQDGLYDIDDRTTKRLFFSHLYTGLSYPGIQQFLGIKEDSSYKPNPVKGSVHKKNLGQLCVWLFGSRERDEPPVIKSQNPDLRRLDEAIQTEQGRDALMAGLPYIILG